MLTCHGQGFEYSQASGKRSRSRAWAAARRPRRDWRAIETHQWTRKPHLWVNEPRCWGAERLITFGCTMYQNPLI